MSIGIWQIVLIVFVAALLLGGARIAKLGSVFGRRAGRLKRRVENVVPAGDDDPNKDDQIVESVVEVAKVANEVRKVAKFPFK